MEIIPLTQGNFQVDKNKNFIPIISENNNQGISDGLNISVRPFVVITSNQTILLDAGLGSRDQESPPLSESIRAQGLVNDQITTILLSHLHKDHIGGLGYFRNGSFRPQFPNAKIYLQARELEFAQSQTQNPSYDQLLLNELACMPNLIRMDKQSDSITPEISYQVSGGHTPYHQVFWIRAYGKTVFYGGDVLPKISYINFPGAYKTDHDGKLALRERQQWVKTATKENWKILLYHDSQNEAAFL
ncbi:MBL fold metallo-hydrolase [Pedobacter jeongneungensis]|uniref:MBL fold metallo-hydrolase n=1 Tax=Pedobacter jeongneungensis TaxID=947309 RepID=UPI00046A391D|nr:MBL fold metallo-hydrolase [Pedobacter jeongneungensis]